VKARCVTFLLAAGYYSLMKNSNWLDANSRHLRLAVRTLVKTPGFTATVVLTLALGIGANTAVFSAINAVLLKPLPFPDGDQLMQINQRSSRNANTFVAPARLRDWDRMNSSLRAITGYYTQDSAELSGDLPEKVKQAFVAPRFLEVWGVAPAIGRDFTNDELRFGGPDAMLISDSFWRKRFNADPNVLGKRLRFRLTSYTIVGVMPASFLFPDRDVEVWSPVFMDAPYAQNRQATWFNVIGRLKPGVTLEQARADMAAVQHDLGRAYGVPDSELTVEILPLKEIAVGGVRQSLWVLFGSVSLLLLIACTNIAALLLARAAHRQHEVAVRYSLGATRTSIIWQLLLEAFVLSVSGAALGVILATAASRAFHRLAATLPRAEEIALDGRILLYTLTCAVVATVLCGIIPAIRGSRDTRSSLAQAGRTQVSTRSTIQWTLVGAQVALAVILLAGAGLLVRSFQALGRVSPGFDMANVLTFRISSSWAESDMRQRAQRTLDFLETVPGIERAAIAFSFPGVPTEFPTELTLLEGRGGSEPKIMVETRFVAPGYFDVMRIPLLAGESCRERPDPAFIGAVANRSFVNAYFPAVDPIGHNLRFPNPAAPPLRILGVVADVRETGINKQPVPVLYSCGTAAQPNAYFLVRTRTEPAALVETIRRKLRELEPTRSVYDISPLEERLTDAFAQNRLRTVLLTFFAVTAVALASIGLYGTLTYFANLRRREVGLRLALGAMRSRIVRQFVGQGLLVSVIGCAAGLGLALAFTRALAGMLFAVSASDPATLSGVIAIMLAVAALASLLPAVRAARVEPMEVLRDE
jgi:putative ABC transport system permease protein